jgi:hypothetical protein
VKPTAFEMSTQIMAALRLRYQAPAWALFEEVCNSTGAGARRRADALAISLWPSRGLELHGVEIKANRTDWLRELKQPDKSETIQGYCDRWWVATSKGLVKPGELPPTWGLLELRGSKLQCQSEAPKLEAQPLDRSFVCAVLRRAHEAQTALLQSARREGCEEGKQTGPEDLRRDLNNVTKLLDGRDKAIEEFEQSSGLRISSWDAGRIGAAVRRLMRLRALEDDPSEELRIRAKHFQNLAAQCEKAATEMDAMARERG